jgi:hypothetical protein
MKSRCGFLEVSGNSKILGELCILNGQMSVMCVLVKVVKVMIMRLYNDRFSRSQWPRGLWHEPPSPVRKLGSWVRIPFEAWMSVCAYSVCVVLCVGSGLAMG